MENEVYMYFQNEKYYLYGAGINAFGVVKYLGKDLYSQRYGPLIFREC